MDDKYDALYAKLVQRPFPERSEDERVDELYGDLHEVDTWVAEGAISAKAGRGIPPWFADVLADIDELDGRVKSLKADVSEQDRQVLESYADYLAMLREIHAGLSDASRGLGR